MPQGSVFFFLVLISIVTEFKLVKLCLDDKNSVGNALTLLVLISIGLLAKILTKCI